MVRFYADEQFPYRIVEALRELEHDILTVQAADNRGLSDEDVLAFAIQENRTILTFNQRHFIRLHNQQPNHTGIIVWLVSRIFRHSFKEKLIERE